LTLQLTTLAAGLLMTALSTIAMAAPAAAPPAALGAPIVYFDIAGPDLTSQAAFYHALFAWEFASDGRVTVPLSTPSPGALPGTLRVEPADQGPITERILYVGVPDITAALAKVTALGGQTVFPRTVVPGVVILALFKDPAGNRMGLVELENGKPKVP
jgi:predicted enzyme related to lactoylglutathione lyase